MQDYGISGMFSLRTGPDCHCVTQTKTIHRDSNVINKGQCSSKSIHGVCSNSFGQSFPSLNTKEQTNKALLAIVKTSHRLSSLWLRLLETDDFSFVEQKLFLIHLSCNWFTLDFRTHASSWHPSVMSCRDTAICMTPYDSQHVHVTCQQHAFEFSFEFFMKGAGGPQQRAKVSRDRGYFIMSDAAPLNERWIPERAKLKTFHLSFVFIVYNPV